jgi:tetratricopeptide (TPR) repeat protein
MIKPMHAILTGGSKLEKATMRIPALIVAFFTAVLTVGALAQQSVPDAPQPQKKQTAKPPDPPPTDPTPAKDDNAFPEDVSKKAAEDSKQTKQPDTGGANPFPEDESRKAAEDSKQTKQPEPSTANPFPEDESKAAAKAAGNDVSSSKPDDAPPVHDPARAKKDTEVGTFYLQTGNYEGALQRYQDATATDPTNVNAIFGLAESQRLLKKNADAARNYELYLDIVPNGPKSKQALKALKEIQPGK